MFFIAQRVTDFIRHVEIILIFFFYFCRWLKIESTVHSMGYQLAHYRVSPDTRKMTNCQVVSLREFETHVKRGPPMDNRHLVLEIHVSSCVCLCFLGRIYVVFYFIIIIVFFFFFRGRVLFSYHSTFCEIF